MLDMVVSLVILSILMLMTGSTLATLTLSSKNSGAETTALAAAEDAVALSGQQGSVTTHQAIITGAAETKGVSIKYYSDNGTVTTVIYHVTPVYGGSADVTITIPDVIWGTPQIGSGVTSSTLPGTPSTPIPQVTLNNYSSTGDTLSWAWAPSTNGTGPYTYYWSVSDTVAPYYTPGCTSGSTTSTSTTCAGMILPGVSYTFSIYAQDSLGAVSSVGSVTVVSTTTTNTTTTTAPPAPPSTPTTPQPYVTSNQPTTMTWSWNPSSGGTGTLTYYWNLSPSAGSCTQAGTTSTSFTCSSLSPGNSYTFSVYAQDPSGNTSNVGSVTATNLVYPSSTTLATTTTVASFISAPVVSVTGASADTPTSSTITWGWTSSAGGTPPIIYQYSLSPTTASCSTGATSTLSYSCSSLTPGTTYTLTVYAQDTKGVTSAPGSATATAPQLPPPTTTTTTTTTPIFGTTTTTAPPPPGFTDTISEPQPTVATNYTPTGASVGTMYWTWPTPAGVIGTPTYTYSITPTACAGGSTSSTSAICNSMVPGTSYTFCVMVSDANGDTPPPSPTLANGGCVAATQAAPSAPTTTTSGVGVAPNPVVVTPPTLYNATATAGSQGATISWYDTYSPITSITVHTYQSTNCSGYAWESGSSTNVINFPDVNTTPSSVYYWGRNYSANGYVADGGNRSAVSACIPVTLNPPTLAGSSLLTTAVTGSATLASVTWSDSGAVGTTAVRVGAWLNSTCSGTANYAAQHGYIPSNSTTSGTINISGSFAPGGTYSARAEKLWNSVSSTTSASGQCKTFYVPAPATTTTTSGVTTTTTVKTTTTTTATNPYPAAPTGVFTGPPNGTDAALTWSESKKIVSVQFRWHIRSACGGSPISTTSKSYSPATTVYKAYQLTPNPAVYSPLSVYVFVTNSYGNTAASCISWTP